MSDEVTVIIPARYNSQRLAGKVLAELGGRPLIEHVYRQACASEVGRVVIATDDERVFSTARDFGAEVVMTSPEHRSGTARVREAAIALGIEDDAGVINVQGDEPLLPPRLVADLAALLMQGSEPLRMATVAERLESAEALFDPNIVKLVLDRQQRALYFSRAPIPWDREHFTPGESSAGMSNGHWLRHIGIYGYTMSLLRAWDGLQTAASEEVESLEQLRALHNGIPIQVTISAEPVPGGVDTEEQLRNLRRSWKQP